MNYRTLTLNHHTYQEAELVAFCQQQLEHPLPEWEHDLYTFINEWVSDAPTVVVNTSGSTGTPKTMTLQKHFMVNSAQMTGKHFNLQPEDTALLCLSTNYIAGKMMVVRAFVLGLNLITVPPDGHPLQHVQESLSFAAMVPLQVHNSIEEHPHQLQHIDQIIVGGGAVSHDLLQRIVRLPNRFYATYGMTETITHVAVKALASESTDYLGLPGVQLGQDERGCLTITAPHLSHETVVTNDLVEFEDFNRFKWLGRYDNVINSGGIKIIPEVLEQLLAELLQQRFFIASLPDKVLGEKVVLVIEGEPFDKHTLSLFKQHLRAELNRFEMPKEIFFVPVFQETPTGKVQRKATLALL